MSKITLLAENLFIIRETATYPTGATAIKYYESPPVWNRSPMKATIFTDYDIGMAHLTLYQTRDMKGVTKWGDGGTRVYDVVPLYGEILGSPNATSITIKKIPPEEPA